MNPQSDPATENSAARTASPEDASAGLAPDGETDTIAAAGRSDAAAADAPPPIQADQEWANALTHGIATVLAIVVGAILTARAGDQAFGLGLAVGAYVAAVVGTFLSSTLSHLILSQPWLNRFRAWDQAMIYLMITGTYTPIVYRYASPAVCGGLLVAIWVAAVAGFTSKTILRHRVNSIGTVSYLLLGWLPAIPLVGRVPAGLGQAMLAGGILYSLGVVVLMNDRRYPYLHAVWHLFVMTAAAAHMCGIYRHVIQG